MAKNSSATQSVDVILFYFSPLFPDGLSGRDQPVELLNPPRVNHMPSSGKEKNLLLNLVPVLGGAGKGSATLPCEWESRMQMQSAGTESVRTCTPLLSQAGRVGFGNGAQQPWESCRGLVGDAWFALEGRGEENKAASEQVLSQPRRRFWSCCSH